jgi:hypothetical protein
MVGTNALEKNKNKNKNQNWLLVAISNNHPTLVDIVVNIKYIANHHSRSKVT